MNLKKPGKRETINLFFSAFLILAFIVCGQFFSQFAANLKGVDGTLSVLGQLVTVLIYVVFGLLLFYATRVGDGKAVKRFSPLTLIILVVPALYIIIASMAKFMPLNNILASTNGTVSVIVSLAGVALGYGIPYTFFSGFELESDEQPAEDEDAVTLEPRKQPGRMPKNPKKPRLRIIPRQRRNNKNKPNKTGAAQAALLF